MDHDLHHNFFGKLVMKIAVMCDGLQAYLAIVY